MFTNAMHSAYAGFLCAAIIFISFCLLSDMQFSWIFFSYQIAWMCARNMHKCTSTHINAINFSLTHFRFCLAPDGQYSGSWNHSIQADLIKLPMRPYNLAICNQPFMLDVSRSFISAMWIFLQLIRDHQQTDETRADDEVNGTYLPQN